MMKCWNFPCKGTLRSQQVTVDYEWQGVKLTFTDVPAHVCDKCGDRHIDPDEKLKMLEGCQAEATRLGIEPDIDHNATDELVCPYCGYVHSDSWEIGDDDGEAECGECGKTFTFTREVSVTYTTERIE